MNDFKSYKKNPHTRPSLQNLNPIFRKREKSEDSKILSSNLIALARKTGVLNLSCRGLANGRYYYFKIATRKHRCRKFTSFCVSDSCPHRRYYHIRVASSTSEMESEDTDPNEEIELDPIDEVKSNSKFPDKVFEINEADKDEKISLDLLVAKEEEAWWNQLPLTNLDLSSNQLMQLSPKIDKLSSLTVLLLHDNGLTSIPREISKLEKLIRINLSRNRLTTLPDEFFTLPNLRYLNLSNNQLKELHPAVSDLHMLDILDVSHNNLVTMPCGIGFLVRVTQLLLSYNHIKELPTDIVSMRSLQKLDLTHNDLVCLPENMGGLRKLQCLYLQHNDIKKLPNFDGCDELQELYVSNNFIESLPENFCSSLPHLKILDVRDNKIKEIIKDIGLLQNLTRLDLTNNSITNLPTSLGNLAHLVSLQVEGNPIKSIRRDILHCGTVRVLKTLRERDFGATSNTDDKPKMGLDGLNSPRMLAVNSDSIYPDKFSMRKSRCLAVTMQNLTTIPEDIFHAAEESKIMLLDLSKNRLQSLPKGLTAVKDCVQDLIFSNNQLVEINPFIGEFSRVSLINLMCNQLKDLPQEFGSLVTLRELNLSNNHFEELPPCIYHLRGLEILHAGNNQIRSIDPAEDKLGALTRLATLNLSNNDIKSLPPKLGTLRHITNLEIVGNPFRLPRYQVIEKGTDAIMSYLRDRIPS